jgi:hypothetical protein
MTTKLVSPEPQKLKFPLIAKYSTTSLVVLFTSEHTGTVLIPGESSCYPVGYYQNEWLFSALWQVLPPEVKVVLSND